MHTQNSQSYTSTKKKESKLLYSNCRLTSLLSKIDKTIEKVMYNIIYKFLDKSNITCWIQIDFRQLYSTSYALINLTEEIMNAVYDGDL